MNGNRREYMNMPPSQLGRLVLFLVILIASWYGLLIVHELGHVIGSGLTGGTIERVVVPFVGFSRTDVSPNPHPLVVAIGGPLIGTVIPVVAWFAIRRCVPRFRGTAGFWAGFCLIANGAYLSFGTIDRIGDAGDLVRHGASVSVLWVVGFVMLIGGLSVWHVEGKVLGTKKTTG